MGGLSTRHTKDSPSRTLPFWECAREPRDDSIAFRGSQALLACAGLGKCCPFQSQHPAAAQLSAAGGRWSLPAWEPSESCETPMECHVGASDMRFSTLIPQRGSFLA